MPETSSPLSLSTMDHENMGQESYDMREAKDFASPKSPKITFNNVNLADFEDASTLEPLPQTLTQTTSTEETFSMRPRSMSHHLSSKDVPSRRWLKIQAKFWRSLMAFAMYFHDWAPPRSVKPAFKHKIPTDTTPIVLYFYLPPRYHETLNRDPNFRFPTVINFHGGGFCLGDARDDRYWARVVLEYTNAIFVSVNYRRAPEHPFPIPVDDCVESILYISEHAPQLHIDQSNIALSGFSAGANLAFTVPFRLAYHRKMEAIDRKSPRPPTSYSMETDSEANEHEDYCHESNGFVTPVQSTSNLVRQQTSTPMAIRCIVAWYPLLDWTMSRSRKIRESRNPKKCLPKLFTDLFDFSYLPPPDIAGDHCSPYASPGLAHDHMIIDGLPQDIQMWLCEWDMLLREGQVFTERLDKLGKRIDSKMIYRVPHAWDKSPNPFRDQRAIDMLYTKSAVNLNKVFQDKEGLGPGNSMSSLHPTDSIIQRQPRRSIVLPV
ncbi:uncharacterized protein Z518_09488 [Rhinocladiella mackenziei CBS 650.93]|uniref:Alpha/beta hydrolase fold-3 domain-containing protein n=1 Tax=Rhinocladiella mackenziei CBS 650.93 TaxID=1442369 RepID=A0A0D2IES2_9EURO|nr:uncharacterized protein Z518_09488 [Rhinocladiella mackenziei CBS 650.93]KIX01761.1 hypothetical protein Z518_09488 [Rhinocladiella mackenziei CBS 650.93]